MAAKITPRLIELAYEAALKSYWRRNALRKFLLASHVADSFLATWSDDESKRDLLDRLFLKLQASDRGKAVIFQMARSLSEQTTFPDLRNWEDSDQKIHEAYKAVQELKIYLKLQDFLPNPSSALCECRYIPLLPVENLINEPIHRQLNFYTSLLLNMVQTVLPSDRLQRELHMLSYKPPFYHQLIQTPKIFFLNV